MSEDQEPDDREGRIRELEATVQSLAADLLDATERIRALEAEVGTRSTDDEERDVEDRWVPAAADGEDSDDSADEDGSERDADDIIVA
ncbi:MAG: hypothetical protein ABEJ55_06410 [Halanaeroarchaeum sp.]